MLFRVYDIDWDTDGEKINLPESMNVTVEYEDELSDVISDITGFCHNGFNYELLGE